MKDIEKLTLERSSACRRALKTDRGGREGRESEKR